MQRPLLLVSSFICLLLFLSGAASVHAADDPILLKPLSVTTTRTLSSAEDIPTSITIITEEEIKEKQYTQVLNLLREEVGIEVVQSGPLGTTSSVFMRGAGSASTLVLIDGVQVNSNTLGSYNFADLTVENIEKIEILRGPQSTLWGSDAVGGVINIITKRGKGKPTHSLSFEGGSFGTFKETLNSSGDLNFMDYSFSVSRTDSEGFSAANENRGNPEKDGYENTTVSTRLGRNFLEDGRVDFVGRFTKSLVDFDASSTTDGNRSSKTDSFYLALPIQKAMMDRWDLKINPTLAYDFTRSSNFDGPLAISFILNRTHGVDVQNNVEINKYFSTTFGFEYEVRNAVNEGGNIRETIKNKGYYLQTQFHYGKSIALTAGFRHDVNSVFKDPTTYKFEAAYRFQQTGTRIRGAYATGFRAPTLNELFFPTFGDPSLKPEESKSWEVGLDQKLMDDKVNIAVTYFETDFENLIFFASLPISPFFKAQNIAEATSKGVETAIDLNLLEDLSLTLRHTWNQTADGDDSPLPRRAKQKFTVTLQHNWKNKLNTLVSVRVRSGARESFSPDIGGFTTVRTALSYKVNKNLKITARGENLFNEDYEEVFGFGTAGISGYGGFTWTFN